MILTLDRKAGFKVRLVGGILSLLALNPTIAVLPFAYGIAAIVRYHKSRKGDSQ